MFAHDFAFDPTYGYSREELLRIGAPADMPPDFASFWQETFADTIARPLNLELRPAAVSGDTEVREVFFDTLAGFRVGAWLVLSRKRPLTRGAVIGHGYGGRQGPELNGHVGACLFPCMPGFNLSGCQGVPADAAHHVLHGIESRDGYILRACVATIWSAVSALRELCPEVGDDISYLGGSFGGGLGALALPWDGRIRRAYLGVPTFGHHPLRLQCPCTGSGESVRLYAQEHPEVIDVLRYYDAATAATFVKVPVLAASALFDPAVPPPGQFAVCNSLAGPRRLFILSAGHFEYPDRAAEERSLDCQINRVIWNAEIG